MRRIYRRSKCIKRKSNRKRCDKRYKRRKSRRKSYRTKRRYKRKRKYKRRRRYKKFRFNLETERRRCNKKINRKYKAYLKSKRRASSGPKRGISGYFQQKKHQKKCKKCDTLRRQYSCSKIYNIDPYCKECLTILSKCGKPRKNIRPLPKIPSRRYRRSSSYYDRAPSRKPPPPPRRYI